MLFQHHFRLNKLLIIDGEQNGARFGQAIATLGDMDQDGYNGSFNLFKL